MNINTKSAFIVLTIINVILMGLLTWGEAEEVQFHLEPFDDMLIVDLTQPIPNLFGLLRATWNGQSVYELDGGGEAVLSRSGAHIALHVTLHNPSSFFGGNPVCRLHATLVTSTLGGPWAMECMRSSFDHPTFSQAGTMIHLPNGGFAASAERSRSPAGGKLAGLQGLE